MAGIHSGALISTMAKNDRDMTLNKVPHHDVRELRFLECQLNGRPGEFNAARPKNKLVA
jgi:hypothetical protein